MTKPIFPLLLSLLLFTGCAAQNPVTETTPATVPTAVQTAEASPALSMELLSKDGAVSQFGLSEPVSGFLPMGQHLLLFSGGDTAALTLMDPETRQAVAVHEAAILLTPENFTVQTLNHGISYFDSAAMETVVLDNTLREIRRIDAPEDLTGAPLLSADGRSLYYCTASAVRVLDLDAGISRILKEASYPVQGLSGLLFGDQALQVSITDTDGSWRTLFLSTETGQLLQECEGNILPESTADRYFVRSGDGSILFGKAGEAAMTLHPKRHDGDCFFLPDTYTALTAVPAGDSAILELYDLKTGGRTAELSLDGALSPRNVGQTADGAVWFLAGEDAPFLYRWDPDASSVSDMKQYSSPYYTREEPDYDGLAACSLYAQEIGARHGVEILIYRDAVALEPWDYRLDYEYQSAVLRRELEALDRRLSNFPAGFLKTLANTFTALRICLVGEITPAADAGSPEAVSGIQFMEGYDAYIALSCGQNTEYALYHELCHLMETVVLTESTAYDRWDMLNPEGFQYDNAYVSNQSREVGPWLREGKEYFIDTYSMSYAKEDRARILEYAMTEGHEELFRSPNLQAKLKQLCTGIREAFGLEDYEGTLLWEQYLDG